jgi:hypothetical protein
MIEEVLRLLQANGYTSNAPTVSVGGVDFNFDAVLSGPGSQNGLIVVATLDGDAARWRRRIANLCTALSRTNSRRPVTAIVLAAEGSPVVDPEAACSTFAVTFADDPKVVLAPLLPLQLPAPSVARESAETLLRAQLGDAARDDLATTLLAAARLGADEVANVLHDSLSFAASAVVDTGDEP